MAYKTVEIGKDKIQGFTISVNGHEGEFAVLDTTVGDFADPAWVAGYHSIQLPEAIYPKHAHYQNPDNYCFKTRKLANMFRLICERRFD
jgi:hypothetical protein